LTAKDAKKGRKDRKDVLKTLSPRKKLFAAIGVQ
jgi:hypothetical protein